jgi:hypothetical protein
MLLHCLYLFEFKFVFEFNFVSSFENRKKVFFSLPPFLFLLAQILLAAQLVLAALLVLVAQLTLRPKADPRRLPLSAAAARWDRVVITFLRPSPLRVRPGARVRATRAPWPWTRSPRTSLAAFKAAFPSPP